MAPADILMMMKNINRGLSAYRKGSVPADNGTNDRRTGKEEDERSRKGAGEPPGEMKRESSKRSPAMGPGEVAAPGFIKQAGTGLEKAAKFIMLLGKERAVEILKHLDVTDVEKITRAIAQSGSISGSEAREILSEFGIIQAQGIPVQGGPETARKMLIAAFGEEKGESYFKRSVPLGGNKPFDFLNEYEYPQIIMILKKEPSHVIAVVLSYLSADLASRVLEALTPEHQKEVVKHIARMKKIDSEVLARMEEVIKNKIMTQGKVITEEIDGKKALADILRHVNQSAEREILGEIGMVDPELSEEIKDLLFTVDALLNLYDRDLQEVLRDYADDELALLLKGKSEEVKQKLLGNVSERRRELITGEMSYMGEVKRSDVDRATRDFLQYIQQMMEEGKIVLMDPRSGDTFV